MDFTDLTDDDLWLQIQDDLYDGLREEVVAETHEALGVVTVRRKFSRRGSSPAWISSALISATAFCSCPRC